MSSHSKTFVLILAALKNSRGSMSSTYRINGLSYNIETAIALTIPKQASYFSSITFQKTWERIKNVCTGDGKWYNNEISQILLEKATKQKKCNISSSKLRLKEAFEKEIDQLTFSSIHKTFCPSSSFIEKAIQGFSLASAKNALGMAMVHFWESRLNVSVAVSEELFKYFHLFGNFNEYVYYQCGITDPVKKWAIATPLMEELQFRLLMQHVLLRSLPKWVLRQLKPTYERHIDHLACKTMRVFSVAFLFALGHYHPEEPRLFEILSHLTAGVALGTTMEVNNSVLFTYYIHTLINTMAGALVYPDEFWPEELLFLKNLDILGG